MPQKKQDIKLDDLPFVFEDDYENTKETLLNLIDSLKVKQLEFNYIRVDNTNLLVNYTEFEFFLKSTIPDDFEICRIDCSRRSRLGLFKKILQEILSIREIEIVDNFKNDGYRLDSTREEIIKKITNHNTI